jgi:phosphoribosylanthranilate isomerase
LRIKICGVTNLQDAHLSAKAGADAIGLNFYPGSPRHIDENQARQIVAGLPLTIETIGVVVNEAPPHLGERMKRLEFLQAIQWHGEQPPLPPIDVKKFIVAFQVRGADDLSRIRAYLDHCQDVGPLPTGILIDAHRAGQYGGTGHRPPWKLLADFRTNVPFILAGGLTPHNVAQAIRIVRPAAVDVSSGVESAPGRKDPDKVRRFVEAAREAFAAHPFRARETSSERET